MRTEYGIVKYGGGEWLESNDLLTGQFMGKYFKIPSEYSSTEFVGRVGDVNFPKVLDNFGRDVHETDKCFHFLDAY